MAKLADGVRACLSLEQRGKENVLSIFIFNVEVSKQTYDKGKHSPWTVGRLVEQSTNVSMFEGSLELLI